VTTTPLHMSTSFNEEPDLDQEEAIPSDGKDVEGEQMMKEVRNSKLSDSDKDAPGTPGALPDGTRDR